MTLMAQEYVYMGRKKFWGGMIAYYAAFKDYGFHPSQLGILVNVSFYAANPGDVFNPTHPTFGNTLVYQQLTNLGSTSCPSTTDSVDWVYLGTASLDLRVTMLSCNVMNNNVAAVTQSISNWGSCNVQQISPYTNLPVCYTTEACKYAQTGYFIGIIICQICNLFACKTRKLSVISQGSSNTFLMFSVTTEIFLVIILTFIYPLNVGFGFRDNIFMHYGTPALPFAMILLVVDETRKYYIRNLPEDETGKPHWFTRAALW